MYLNLFGPPLLLSQLQISLLIPLGIISFVATVIITNPTKDGGNFMLFLTGHNLMLSAHLYIFIFIILGLPVLTVCIMVQLPGLI